MFFLLVINHALGLVLLKLHSQKYDRRHRETAQNKNPPMCNNCMCINCFFFYDATNYLRHESIGLRTALDPPLMSDH